MLRIINRRSPLSLLSNRNRLLSTYTSTPSQIGNQPPSPPVASAVAADDVPKKSSWVKRLFKFGFFGALTGVVGTTGYATYAYTSEEVDNKTKWFRDPTTNIVKDDASALEKYQALLYSTAMSGMEAPSYYHMRVTLLKEVFDDTQKFVEGFHPFWKKYGCSIMSDFWTDGKGRSLINFLVNCPKGTVFLKSIDASEHVKRAEYIVDLIEEIIDFVGAENVVQFITDNGSNYKRAGSILEEKYPKMFWAPCAAHCLNLMLKELSESKEAPLNKIGKVLLEARSIVVFIYNHGRVLDMMRKFTKKKELHRSCVTRFASQFYTLESLERNKNALRMMFVSDAWISTDFAKTVEGKRVARIVSRVRFWEDLRFSCSILAPLVDVLRLVDTEEKPCMGYLQEAMDRAKELIKKNIGENLAATNEAKKECRRITNLIWSIVDKKWDDQLDRPLHSAGLYLNPGLYYKSSASSDDYLSIEGNAKVKSGLFKVFNRLVPDFEENDKLVGELILYRDALKSFGEPQAIRSRETLAPVPAKSVELYLDLRRSIEANIQEWSDPSYDASLPDMLPEEQRIRIFTLVLDLSETLIYSDWKRERGWRTFKRPGVDAFLEHLAQFYEIVVYTDKPGMDTDHIMERLNVKGCIRHVRSRAATKYMNGKHYRDLSRLNRDPSRIIYVSGHALESTLQPENSIQIKPWKLEADDTALLDLIPFLECVGIRKPDDVRQTLASYKGQDIASEFIKRSQEAQRQAQEQKPALGRIWRR